MDPVFVDDEAPTVLELRAAPDVDREVIEEDTLAPALLEPEPRAEAPTASRLAVPVLAVALDELVDDDPDLPAVAARSEFGSLPLEASCAMPSDDIDVAPDV